MVRTFLKDWKLFPSKGEMHSEGDRKEFCVLFTRCHRDHNGCILGATSVGFLRNGKWETNLEVYIRHFLNFAASLPNCLIWWYFHSSDIERCSPQKTHALFSVLRYSFGLVMTFLNFRDVNKGNKWGTKEIKNRAKEKKHTAVFWLYCYLFKFPNLKHKQKVLTAVMWALLLQRNCSTLQISRESARLSHDPTKIRS